MAGDVPASHIAQWDGDQWSPLAGGTNGAVYEVASKGDSLFAAGAFTTAGGIPASFVALWNGTSWSALGSGTDGIAYAVSVRGTDVYVGGVFNHAGGASASRVAHWNGMAWSALGTGVETVSGFEVVYAVQAVGSDVYVGGTFDRAGGVTVNNIGIWNGITWNSLGSGIGGNGGFEIVHDLAADSHTVYACGIFQTAGAFGSTGIAAWPQSTIVPLGAGWNLVSLPRVVQDSAAIDLFPGTETGSFYSYNGSTYQPVAAFAGGIGYWCLRTSAAKVYVPGDSRDSVSVDVTSGPANAQWIMLGSTTSVIAPDHVISEPAGHIEPGSLYEYNGTGYVAPAAIIPGKGYWILVSGQCKLKLRS
jgi:hypothetical protein